MARRTPPRHPPHPSRTFQLEAAAVQQGLFSPHAYERRPEREEEPEVDERQIDLFGPPPPKKNPRQPKSRRAKAGGEVGINKEFYPGGTFLPTTNLPKGERPRYTSGSGRQLVAPGVHEVPPLGMRAIFASLTALIQHRSDGTIQPLPPSHPVWESGMHGSYEEAAAMCAAWNAGERFYDPEVGLRSMRENTSRQRFIRRTPSREGSKRRHRYTYNVDEATRVNVKARVKEKIRIPHHGIPGHYEVVERLAPDVVGVVHDETGHSMVISDVALRELARDTYRAAPDTTPAEDVRHRHEREDALPRSRDGAYRAIQQASGIDDHDFAQADQAYREWKAGKGKRGRPKPPPWRGGQLDAFEVDLKRGKHFSSLLEAFEHASRGAQTWRDLEPVLALLRDVPGFEDARFPEEVYNRHLQHEAELADQGHTLDVEHYGVTMVPGMEVGEAVFLAATTTPPRLRKPLSESDAAIGAHDEGGEEDDLWGWG